MVLRMLLRAGSAVIGPRNDRMQDPKRLQYADITCHKGEDRDADAALREDADEGILEEVRRRVGSGSGVEEEGGEGAGDV